MFRPPTKYSEYLQDLQKSIDYILKRVNAKYVSKILAGTNVTISPADGTGIVTINASIPSTGYYGAFSDYTNQTAAAINTGYPMRLGTTDLNNQVTIQSNSRITFNFAGKYNLQWSAQFINQDTQEHDISIWLRRNGTNVVGSAGIVSVASSHGGVDGHVLPSWNFVVEAAANDYYEFVWSTSSTQISIVAFAASGFAPSTASIVVTATPVIGSGIVNTINSVVKSTYALMIADGTPSVDTIYSITNDENKSYVRSTYLWKSNGNREWIATTPDN
jgi:hypothetical protein